ncbi:hypothetical protein GOP47_0001219 [Adiantum capillus-veneris]|uniref:Glycosyltransferase n=1 Tax=Adiantum capillus-veneris TaxID=13818 RepID=A0A9D4VEF0_ADICA|nr:hypothetical protein GOP47_0001219 [Adiantum capillus-veneris]
MHSMAAPGHSKPHALAVPLPFQGHIHPLFDLSLKLVSAGFMVTFANTHSNHQRITCHQIENGTTTQEGKDSEDLQFISLGEEFLVECGSPFDTLIEMFKPAVKAAVARLLAQLNEKGPPVSLLLFDFRLAYVLDLAIAAGIPSISLWTQTAANFVCNTMVSQGFQPPTDDSIVFTCARGVPPLTSKNITGVFLGSIPAPFPSDEYAWLPFRRVDEPTWIVINTFEELEATTLDTIEEIVGFRPLALGPLINAPSFNICKGASVTSWQSHLDWLQMHPKHSVLYIAFGTLANISKVQLEELVLGLEASGQPFLWVFRDNLCVQTEEYTLESLTRRLGPQGLMVPWASQREVLSHASVGGFLTHCGWNSTIEGINAGVPMLTWPILVDQFLNQRCIVEQWGIGLGFDASGGTSGLITKTEVVKKVRTLMQSEVGKQIREKAKNLSNLAQRASEEGGSSHKCLDRLKQEIWKFHIKK